MADLIKVFSDREKAKSLLKMADEHLKRIDFLKNAKKDFSSLNILDYYSAIKNLLIALLLLKGFKTKGEGSHFEMISFVSQNYSEITDFELNLIDKLRQFRNKINYEGFQIASDYLERNEDHIIDLIDKLKDTTEEKL